MFSKREADTLLDHIWNWGWEILEESIENYYREINPIIVIPHNIRLHIQGSNTTALAHIFGCLFSFPVTQNPGLMTIRMLSPSRRGSSGSI